MISKKGGGKNGDKRHTNVKSRKGKVQKRGRAKENIKSVRSVEYASEGAEIHRVSKMKKNEKEGTLEYYLELSDEDFIEEMNKFEGWLEEEEQK